MVASEGAGNDQNARVRALFVKELASQQDVVVTVVRDESLALPSGRVQLRVVGPPLPVVVVDALDIQSQAACDRGHLEWHILVEKESDPAQGEKSKPGIP